LPHQQTKQKKILFGLGAHTLKKQDQLLAAFGQNVVREFGEAIRCKEESGLESEERIGGIERSGEGSSFF